MEANLKLIVYQKQLLSLRTDRDTFDEIDIPFNKIQSAKIMKEPSKIQIRIVAGDISTGTESYILNIGDLKYGAIYKKSEWDYKVTMECVQLIIDELNNIMLHYVIRG